MRQIDALKTESGDFALERQSLNAAKSFNVKRAKFAGNFYRIT